MKLSVIINSFLVYLQNNNAIYGNNRYQSSWLEQQASEFQNAMTYAEQSFPAVYTDAAEGNGIVDFLKNIHQHCAKEAYQIITNVAQSQKTKLERAGQLRLDESFSMKIAPVFNSQNATDLEFFRSGRMPRILDARLQLMGYDLSNMSFRKKALAMHNQPAWLEANNVLQIAEYMRHYVGRQESFYFLSAYYKEHFLKSTRQDDPKQVQFAQHLEKEIKTIATELDLTFNVKKTRLTAGEKAAYEVVYISYPLPKRIEKLLRDFAQETIITLRRLDFNDIDGVATFCFQTYLRYIQIHPFMDANYRTYSIFMNAVLTYFGFEYVDFHNLELKNRWSTQFNQATPNASLAIDVFSTALKTTKKSPHRIKECMESGITLFASPTNNVCSMTTDEQLVVNNQSISV